ncbi:MAG: hypothetical protein HC923_03415 [Myxococcales bacterium]|nr:hypothetical protein [Myxococcales bacterium]
MTWNEPPPEHNLTQNAGVTVSFSRGELFGGYKTVVWFLVEDPDPNVPNRGALRRVVFDDDTPTCAARDVSCGALIASNVEALFYRIYQFAPDTGWALVPDGTFPTDDGRLRVDLELIVRSEDAQAQKTFAPIAADLAPGGPRTIPPGPDRIERRSFRTTIEVRNAGRL